MARAVLHAVLVRRTALLRTLLLSWKRYRITVLVVRTFQCLRAHWRYLRHVAVAAQANGLRRVQEIRATADRSVDVCEPPAGLFWRSVHGGARGHRAAGRTIRTHVDGLGRGNP